MKLLPSVVLIIALMINVLLYARLQEAVNRIDESDAFNVQVMSQMDDLAKCASMCDEVLLKRQNLIIVEIQRLDYNQKQLAESVLLSVDDLTEADE